MIDGLPIPILDSTQGRSSSLSLERFHGLTHLSSQNFFKPIFKAYFKPFFKTTFKIFCPIFGRSFILIYSLTFCLAICLTISLSVGSQSPVYGQSISKSSAAFNLAFAMYKNKQYIPAAAQFMKTWQQEPDNARAAYYAAYCLYMGGQKDNAIKSFWLVVDHFPNRTEGARAREFLKRIDINYQKHGGDSKKALAKVLGRTSSASGSNTSSSASSSERKKLSNDELVEAMLEVHRPRGKIPAVSGNFVTRSKEILVGLPRYILLMMHERKARVHLVPALVETDYRMQNVRPRGYDEGSSWQNSTAMCSGRNLYIAQYRKDSRTGNYVSTDMEIGSIRHETGHCVDYCLGYISQKDKFRHAYRLDAARVPAADRSRLDYFLQAASGGPSETFAELCCHRFGGETDEWRIVTCNKVKQYFKGPDAILEGYLKSIEQKYQGK